ncbi:unnamed protein product [Spirodela intermedia]|uniref:Uncharacterized protein n=1 Tax=Spirodela intermedia TaxID=51605 RepID=A0ABN7EAQ4_SPIIN|nr:unnamed protein product [Spirodela intermedia]
MWAVSRFSCKVYKLMKWVIESSPATVTWQRRTPQPVCWRTWTAATCSRSMGV